MEEAPIPYVKTPKGVDKKEDFLEYKEFKLNNEGSFIEIIIVKTAKNIIIKALYYEIRLTPKELSVLTKIMCNSVNEVYEFIKNSFDQKKVIIKNIAINQMKLIILVYDPFKRKEKEVEIILLSNFKNEEYIFYYLINKYFKLDKEINSIKNNYNKIIEENKQIKEENRQIKEENRQIKTEINQIKQANLEIQSQINLLESKMNNNQIRGQMTNQPNQNLMNYNMGMKKSLTFSQNQNFRNPFSRIDNNNNNYDDDKWLQGFGVEEDNKPIPKQVYFRQSGNDFPKKMLPIKIDCFDWEKISQLISKYREKAGYSYIKLKFVYNGQLLNQDLTVGEAGIINNSNIFVVMDHNY